MNIHHHDHHGFALLELLVYIGVLILTLLVVMTSISSFARVYGRVNASQSLARSGATAMERIVREIRNAERIDQTASTLGTHPGRLTLITPVLAGVTKTSMFSVVSNGIRLSENGVVTGMITSDDVIVENLTFQRITTANSEAVRIVLTLSKNVGTTTQSSTFYDTAVVRGSYAL